MDGPDRHEAWVTAIKSMLGDRVTGPGRHVWDRLARLLQYAEVRWVDGELYEDDMRLNGTLGVFTDDIVAIVDLAREERSYDHGWGSRDSGLTNIRLRPRAALQGIDVFMSEEDGGVNAKWRWLRVGEQGTVHDNWPTTSPITLRYTDATVTVNGPVRDVRSVDMSDFMESLLRDLAA